MPNNLLLATKIIGMVLVVSIVVLTGLSQLKLNTLSGSVISQESAALKVLNEKKSDYVKCDGFITESGETNADIQILNALGFERRNEYEKIINRYHELVHGKCDPVISEYTEAWKSFLIAQEEKSKADLSVLDEILKNSPSVIVPTDVDMTYNPEKMINLTNEPVIDPSIVINE